VQVNHQLKSQIELPCIIPCAASLYW
jgi:hypothetical protein